MIKVSILLHNTDTFNFDQLPFQYQLSYESVTYLFGKPKLPVIESKDEIGHNSMLSIHQTNLKSGHLLHKMALVQSQRNSTVPVFQTCQYYCLKQKQY